MLTVLHGDALTRLKALEPEGVQTCVTSPPYWGLRDYGVEPSVWDAKAGCVHDWQDASYVRNNDLTAGEKQRTNVGAIGRDEPVSSAFCECGAWRGALGLEPTPELYVQHVVDIFREVRLVLRKDGTLWVNLGDSYAGGHCAYSDKRWQHGAGPNRYMRTLGGPGLKAKDLVGIPWMVAFALRADGWYLRSDIIWSKPNPMPESVTDRPTKAHEYIFLLSKSGKYHYDAAAIREPAMVGDHPRSRNKEYAGALTPRGSMKRAHDDSELGIEAGRNRRSVWTVTTQPFSEAHFATFPPDLITPCILAGAPLGGVVLDPFAGSGTTGKVAIELGRRAILIEPKAEYVEMIERRCRTTIGLPFGTEASPELSLET